MSEKSRSLTPKPVKESMKIHKALAGGIKYKVGFGADEVEVGDFANKRFSPQVKIKRWGDEAYLNVGVNTANIPAQDESVDLQADRVGWDSPKIGAGFIKQNKRG